MKLFLPLLFSKFASVACVAFVALLANQASADALVEFRAFSKDLSALSGSFSQEVRDKNGRVTRTSAGTFSLAKPGKFRFVYEKPYKQTIVSDGKTMWLHDEDLNQVTIRKLDQSLADQPLSLLLDPQNADRVFDVKASPQRGSIKYVLATAKKAESPVNDVSIALVEGQPVELVWRDALLNINTLRFGKLARNERTEQSTFDFVPPKGAEVLKL